MRQQFLIDFSSLFGPTFDVFFFTVYLIKKQVVIQPTYRPKVGREEYMMNWRDVEGNDCEVTWGNLQQMLEENMKNSEQSISKKEKPTWMEVRSFADSANIPADTTKMILRTRWLKLHYSIADVSVCVMEQSPRSFRSLSYRRRLPADRQTSPVISRSAQFTFQQTITSLYNNRIRNPLCGQADGPSAL